MPILDGRAFGLGRLDAYKQECQNAVKDDEGKFETMDLAPERRYTDEMTFRMIVNNYSQPIDHSIFHLNNPS